MLGIGSTIKMITILIVVLLIAGGLWYVTGLRADLAVSQANAEKLQQGIEQQQALMEQMRADIAKIQAINNDLNKEASRARDEVKAVTEKFSVNSRGESRDFGASAAAKPGIFERLVNRGTANAMRCLEIASGAPLTDAERNAKNQSEINRECPTLANPNYRPIAP